MKQIMNHCQCINRLKDSIIIYANPLTGWKALFVPTEGLYAYLLYLFFVKALIKSRFILKKIDVQSK